MYAKMQITGTLRILTGLHIGTSDAFAAIGAVDSQVVRDTLTRLPMIPGSSFKGKMRTLLARTYNQNILDKVENDAPSIKRLFGTAQKGSATHSRIIVSDMLLCNLSTLQKAEVLPTEVKFENTINRATAVANPRQIERVISGSEFTLDILYEVTEEKEIIDDIAMLAQGLTLLSYDYLGGHGSRGYGRIGFDSLQIKTVLGSVPADIVEACMTKLQQVPTHS